MALVYRVEFVLTNLSCPYELTLSAAFKEAATATYSKATYY